MSLTRRTIAVRLGFFFTNIDDINTSLTPLFLQSNPIFVILRAIFSWLAWCKISFVPTWIAIASGLSSIKHIPISLGSKFQLQQTALISWNELTKKRILPLKNRKNEHCHQILHIRISLRTKFQLKLTGISRYFQFKTENLNFTI